MTASGPSTIGILAAPVAATDSLVMLLNNSTTNATSHGVSLGAGFGTGIFVASVFGNSISTLTGPYDIHVETNGTATVNLNARGNALDPNVGTIRLNEIGGDINVTQSAPGTTLLGMDAANVLRQRMSWFQEMSLTSASYR